MLGSECGVKKRVEKLEIVQYVDLYKKEEGS
jgi:hypothetical protein